GRLSSLGSGDAVILLSHFIDNAGKMMSLTDGIEYILHDTKVPVYVITDTRICKGVLGGMVVSGYYQGTTAGKIVNRILDGEPASTIPVEINNSSRYIFDNRALVRLNIDRARLPSESVIVNAPDTIYQKYRNAFRILVGVIIPLIVIVVVLMINILSRRRAENELGEIKKRYHLITGNMSDTIWMIDKNMKTLFLSPSIMRNCGYTMKEMWDMPWEKHFTPSSFRTAKEFIARCLNSDRINDPDYVIREKIELEFVRKDGSVFLSETQINIVRDGNSVPIGILGVGRDITERRSIENSLKESERRMRELLENVQLITIMLDSHGKLIFCNDYFLNMSGWRRDEVINRRWNDFFVPPDQGDREDRYFQISDAGVPLNFEKEIITRAGDKRTIHWNNTVMRDAGGTSIGITSIGIDVTEKRKSEIELRESEQKFRTLIEQSTEGIVLIDERGVIIEWNRALEEMTGVLRAGAIGEYFWDVQFRGLPLDLQQAERYARYKTEIEEALRTGNALFLNRPLDVTLFNDSGEKRFVSQRVFPIKTDNGFRLGSITIDITSRKVAEDGVR
ncbi:MAG TPA: ABC transporter substrate binding protein, partial [Spirochaetota bacterium]